MSGFQEAHYWVENKNTVVSIQGIVLWKRRPPFLHLYSYGVCVGGVAHSSCLENELTAGRSCFSSSSPWVLGIQLRLSDFVACTLPHWAISATKSFLKLAIKTHKVKWRANVWKEKDPTRAFLAGQSMASWIIGLRINQIMSEHHSQLFQQERREKGEKRKEERGKEKTKDRTKEERERRKQCKGGRKL